MAKRTINLDMTACENREMRIGSITSWDGSASELVEASDYELRGRGEKKKGCAGGKGKLCQLCELNMPFSQQTMCANAIVGCQIGNITDCILIDHGPIGCSANHARFNLGYKMGLVRRGKTVENIRIFSTNLKEKDMVFGASDRLRQTIQDAYDRYHPKAIFISMSCSTAIIGEDIDSVADEKEAELGIPVVPLHCEGFRSKHWSTGFDISQHGVVRQIVKRNPVKQPDLINIVALWGTDYFTEMLKPLGLRVNYMIDMASYDELAQASEAVATATFCHTLGSYMATALEEHFGVPQIDAPQSSLKIVKGDLFVVLTGCSGELIGDDVASVVKKYKKQGYNIVFADTAGFKGNNLKGHEIVVRAIIDQFVGDFKGRKRKKLINLWSEVPYFNTFWRGDLIELKRILEGAGFEVNVFFGPQSAGISEWKNIPKAAFNLVVSPWVGLDIAEYLQQKYDQPYLHIPVLPVGEEATSAFLRKVVAFAESDAKKAEKFIEKEAHEYYYFLEHFADFFAEYWFGLPSKFAAVGDSTYNIALTKFLADQVGLLPVKQIITDDPPEKYRESISALYHDLSEGVEAEPEYIEDGYLVEQSLRETNFGSGVPLILGSSWEADVATERHGILLEVGTPATEEVVINRSYIGYRGALSLLEKIYTATVGGK